MAEESDLAADSKYIRTAADLQVQLVLSSLDRVISETIASARWIQASLLLINAGGAVAIVGIADPTPRLAWAGASFVVGIAFSFLLAQFANVSMGQAPRRLVKLAEYWLTVVHGMSPENEKQTYADALAEFERKGKRIQLLGWLSGASFLTGCVLVGWALMHSVA